MNLSFTNKVVLVTGGTSGIGKSTAVAFAEAGGKVVITGRREKEGANVVAEIDKKGGTAKFVRADISNDEDVEKMIDFVLSTYGRLDVAFNNAGESFSTPFDQIDKKQYSTIFDVNVWGVLNSMKHEIKLMLRNGGGAIVNNSSVAGQRGLPEYTIYTASKHAVEGLTKAVALEFATRGIRINAVAPAAIKTEMLDRTLYKDAERREYVRLLHPVERIGSSEEVAAAVLYLASDTAKFTTGTILKVDGGYSAK
jgi:NAD(P)-dependent dehydrogenase (short-subunit alcohol dehydrogenase family)